MILPATPAPRKHRGRNPKVGTLHGSWPQLVVPHQEFLELFKFVSLSWSNSLITRRDFIGWSLSVGKDTGKLGPQSSLQLNICSGVIPWRIIPPTGTNTQLGFYRLVDTVAVSIKDGSCITELASIMALVKGLSFNQTIQQLAGDTSINNGIIKNHPLRS